MTTDQLNARFIKRYQEFRGLNPDGDVVDAECFPDLEKLLPPRRGDVTEESLVPTGTVAFQNSIFVRRYQYRRGLKVDGIAGDSETMPDLLRLLGKAPSLVLPVHNSFEEWFAGSPNCYPGRNECKHLVLHHSDGWSRYGDSRDGDYSWTMRSRAQGGGGVAYHCIVSWTGRRTVYVRDGDRAWHAGISSWNGRTNCNDFTIGLCFGGDTNNGLYRPNGQRNLTDPELASAVEFILPRMKKYHWTLEDIITHQMIAPRRKWDTSNALLIQVREALARSGAV